ncbi:MAG: CCA tRNA nucleotidyltransferase [Furfurilactobacillus sp.]|jgi:tRNA nucleotidyltransferase (CCA-adding enzyme)|uniref:CCA-adding enzyme n=1 Tax=Furfurilactobacillus milii TaxID=2888272 RepID=A0ABT6D709_9LACO|nr:MULTISPECIES: CCA tRNA nucleotidyltransferase [Furfurilactobacillus]QLE66518.1 tRNA nucleotidyltransferase [Furfurilactobacillus rossiae]MCF6159971.1 CCA tRNA nucleotidyltransferase [Furfurilactobacillus milii]MCF6162480.1 CCA tRNA nucleotidyltransferase [Furfurilactobacillus milii]MCF6419349.1 CCA tRNA nucleotidyltransferase [Furfurilactobacillus milii]MCH4010775.1 CCA tRNA nucleotidyltransferase [Furfurilactobacillus sp.]
MRLAQLPREFVGAQPILTTLEAAGYEAYFVGGSVRDTILGKPIHDVDIATSAYPEEVKALFKRTVDTGIEHGTVMILDHGTGYETTTFRTESGYQDYRRPDKVTFVRHLEDDLKRRDFTINALALRQDGEVIDLFDGLSDLKAGIIRAVGDPEARFGEDALRMMRAVRFASQLNFKIEDKTLAAIHTHAHLLSQIAVERIHDEFVRMMLGKAAYRGLSMMIQTTLADYCPGLVGHTIDLSTIATVPALAPKDEVEVWAMVAFHLGLSYPDTVEFLQAWKTANHIIKAANQALHLAYAQQYHGVTKQLLFAMTPDTIAAGTNVARMSGYGPDDPNEWLRVYNELPIKDSHDLALSGADLIKKAGLTPGPAVGETLQKVQNAVIDGELNNEAAELLKYVQDKILAKNDTSTKK